jgi:hypothetical protein
MHAMQVQRIDFPTTEGVGARYVVALAFSPCGTRLVAVTGDNRHTVTMFDWQKKTAVFSGNGHNGQPPQVWAAAGPGGKGARAGVLLLVASRSAAAAWGLVN